MSSKGLKGKLAAYFKLRMGFFDYGSKKGWTLKGDCMYCGGESKMGINLGANRTNCFKCSEHPSPIQLVMDNEDITLKSEAIALLSKLEDLPYLDIPTEFVKRDIKPELPKEFRLIGINTDHTAKLVEDILKSRGFNIDQLMMKGVGYCVTGPYKGRIIMPFYYGGRLVYFNARKFIEMGSKFKNPSYEEFGIGKALLIYNIDALAMYNRIRVVESITNSWTIGDSAIGIGGKVISDHQLSNVIRSPVKKVSIMLDPDAYIYGLRMGLVMCRYKQTRVIKFPEGCDVNDLGRKETLKLEEHTPYQSYQDLYKLYLYEKHQTT